ncbi:MAG: indole-3-glycerol phosphate synthase TrpC [Candidatus Omnitrophica bacterium]|nr:indole-3-glycerol phosphate synthase TrpC [Candidatus Omnitrophota bacterium]MDD5237312.1 indole-3-glycerol phosphate synthase TrpC [Candidatus Omnitrophota bacterium]MDD5610989.1 indole-3-glycerol phosphate synthase TrpC [Candidatus Omnitrophota bacterium]
MSAKDAIKEIVQKKKERLLILKQQQPEELLKEKIAALPPTRPFVESINKPRVISLIAEIKKATPLEGAIRENFDPAGIAAIYQEVGVQALSVLTEEDYFQGSPEHLVSVRQAVELPILRKDFIFEPYQVYETRALGADAILFITDLLTKDALAELVNLATQLGMASIVEVHTEKELKKVLNLKLPFVIGINNRDLHTLEVDFKTTEKLYPMIPRERVVVVESGVKTSQDVLFLKILGVNAILVGRAFMQAENLRTKVEELMGW